VTTPRPMLHDPVHAFCQDSAAYLPGAPHGPLASLTFAAKDIFDVAGFVTGGGNPDWKATHAPATQTAWAVHVLVAAGATMVGKTITDELTRGIFGDNVHYGTPINPRAVDRVPGGSSSGSAAAVAAGLVDFALGSDTGGSVRVPASFCGLYGLRPTHGRIPLAGLLLQAPSYDTIGWFTRDLETFARVGAVLLQSPMTAARPRRLLIAADAFDLAEPAVAAALRPAVETIASLVDQVSTERLAPMRLSDWAEQQQVLQGREAWETVHDWIDQVNPRFSFEVTMRYLFGRDVSEAQLEAARAARDAIRAHMQAVLSHHDVVCLPTTVAPAPRRGERLSARSHLRSGNSALTSIAGTIGAPQLNLPVAEVEGLPVGLSLLGARGADELLIAFAHEVVDALGR
jgi:amidase